MVKSILNTLLFIGLLTVGFTVKAQEKSVNYYNYIDAYDLSGLWTGDKLSIWVEDHFQEIDFPEPLGYIGNNYQRFYIHYTSVIKDATNPYNYKVKGKTRVNNTICSFKGTITVIGAYIDPQLHLGKYNRGQVICKVDLQEDPRQPESGYFKGSMVSNWYLDKKELHYDAIDIVSDNFCNNQCIATWTSYKTHQTKTCKWGDFRIPKSGNLDIGTGEFRVNQKFVGNGWKNYQLSLDRNKKASQLERSIWWK